jgi:hypothetical protein
VNVLQSHAVATPSLPPLPPPLRAWVQRERTWAGQALGLIARQRRLVASEGHGLARFTLRMTLVELTGSVAAWASGLHDGLARHGYAEAAAAFAVGPPFAATDPSGADYDALGDYVEGRRALLAELLDADRA